MVAVAINASLAATILASRAYASCSTLEGSSQHYQEFKWQDGLLFYKNLLYVPDGSPRLQVLEHCHDAPMAGHFGIAKTMELVKRSFWWPHLQNFVEDYVCTCDTCCRAKIPMPHPYGLLQPLPPPTKPWQSISMDFITDLPPSKGFDTILTVVD